SHGHPCRVSPRDGPACTRRGRCAPSCACTGSGRSSSRKAQQQDDDALTATATGLPRGAAGAQHAACVAPAGAASLNTGMSPSVLKCSQAMPCGSVTQYLSLRAEEHTSELQSRENLVCRLLLEKKKNNR